MTTAQKNIDAMANDATKTVENAMTAGKETFEKVVKASQDAAQQGYEQAMTMTKDNVEKASQQFHQGYEQLSSLQKDNIEAMMQSTTIFAKGMETMSKEMFTLGQAAFEANLAAVKQLMGVKTLREAIDLQSEITRKQMDKAMADSGKLTEMSMKVANEAFQPIQTRVNTTIETISKSAAA